MKKLHLLCNAHIDPAWLWRWNEGAAEAVSTFRVAVKFLKKYAGFVFNHNESLLYEWVEEYEPELFEEIKKLVAEGKWHIMGGWYLQPDCVMTSGESLLSQIELGRKYFYEKFGVKPKTAINGDPFGHTRGLVQILKVTGFENYLFMRPLEYKGEFWWEGFDGSKIRAHRMFEGYGTPRKGMAEGRITRCIAENRSEIELCPWGIGNHGGGPSEIDMQKIGQLMETSDVEIIHSDADTFFDETDTSKLETYSKSLSPCMVGCYTSMVRIKQANRRLENKIAATEKILSYANMLYGLDYPEEKMTEAKKALAFCQFHDILPGSAIKKVEDDSLRTLSYGEEITERLYNRAFFKMCAGQKQAKGGTIPVLAFNPHPYEIEGEFEVSYMLEDQNGTDDEETIAIAYDENGNRLPTQNIKEDSTLALDWAKKIIFRGKLKPACITRFDCELKIIHPSQVKKPEYGDRITFKNDRMETVINRKTGLLEKYVVDGKLLAQNSGIIKVYNDDEDPWGMKVYSFPNFAEDFTLMSDEEANEFVGYPDEKLPNVRVVEDGEVCLKVQSFWKYKTSAAVIEYTIPKNDIYVDVKITVHSNEPNKMLKYNINTAFSGTPWGQTAFGKEELWENGDEAVFQKWCSVENSDDGLAVLNRGTYGGSFTENSINISLLRTPVYSAHPIGGRPYVPHTRFSEHIDIGERIFYFRITPAEDLDRKAQIFNETPELLSFFPSGDGENKGSAITVDNSDIILSSVRLTDGKYKLTLYNSTEHECEATIKVMGKELHEKFGKYQLKFIEI